MSKITLQQPIPRGTTDVISSIELRKPTAGELRGLKLTDVLQMDVSAMMILLPRISSPAITPDEAAGLDVADLMSLAGVVVGFFMTQADRVTMGLH